jgi:predicted small metal-binding protein
MKKYSAAALLALALALLAPVFAATADAPKSEMPKPPMFSAKCKAPCSFSVKSHDRTEVVALLQEHAKAHHNGLVLSDADAEAMVKTSDHKKQ